MTTHSAENQFMNARRVERRWRRGDYRPSGLGSQIWHRVRKAFGVPPELPIGQDWFDSYEVAAMSGVEHKEVIGSAYKLIHAFEPDQFPDGTLCFVKDTVARQTIAYFSPKGMSMLALCLSKEKDKASH